MYLDLFRTAIGDKIGERIEDASMKRTRAASGRLTRA
jgi:hypothetical protein